MKSTADKIAYYCERYLSLLWQIDLAIGSLGKNYDAGNSQDLYAVIMKFQLGKLFNDVNLVLRTMADQMRRTWPSRPIDTELWNRVVNQSREIPLARSGSARLNRIIESNVEQLQECFPDLQQGQRQSQLQVVAEASEVFLLMAEQLETYLFELEEEKQLKEKSIKQEKEKDMHTCIEQLTAATTALDLKGI